MEITQKKPTVMGRLREWAGMQVAKSLWAGRSYKVPQRETTAYARLQNLGAVSFQKDRPLIKPSPSNLRKFANTPYARRAINRIKNSIVSKKWEVRPKHGIKLNSELQRQIDLATMCLERPNRDDSFRTLCEQVIEDYLIAGAGAIEQEVSNDPNRPLWLWPVDSLSIQIYAGWSGAKNEARYVQTLGYGNVGGVQGVKLRNDQLIYIRKDPTTNNPFGYGCLEVAFNSVNRLLGVGEYAGNVAGNGQPENLLQFKGLDQINLDRMRTWWRNEIEGQGQTPLLGGDDITVHKLRTAKDEALYLGYQQFLIREIATAFELSPQNLGVEADVNRNTAEVADDRDYNGIITPTAHNLAAYITREALHVSLGFSQLEFAFLGLEREDELNLAQVFETEYQNNAVTPNEYREKRGLPPLNSPWGDLLAADVAIATIAAKGLGADLDPNLPDKGSGAKSKKKGAKDSD